MAGCFCVERTNIVSVTACDRNSGESLGLQYLITASSVTKRKCEQPTSPLLQRWCTALIPSRICRSLILGVSADQMTASTDPAIPAEGCKPKMLSSSLAPTPSAHLESRTVAVVKVVHAAHLQIQRAVQHIIQPRFGCLELCVGALQYALQGARSRAMQF